MPADSERDLSSHEDDLPNAANTTDYAWKTLTLINDWIRVADAKTGVTLATAGAAGVMLYNLVKERPGFMCWGALLAPVACGLLIIAAVTFSALSLIPRTTPRNLLEENATANQPSPFFYGTISTKWKREAYITALTETISNPDQLVRHIAMQVHINADIASKKFAWSNRAIKATLAAVFCLGIVAIRALMGS